jgi:hypothetical protein
MQTLETFLARSTLGLRCQEVTPNGDEVVVSEPRATNYYLCELHGSNGDRPLRTTIGTDDGPPEITEVLDAVAAEAAVAESAGGFEAWADQMGYDRDSRQAEREYRAVLRDARLLRRLLGENAYWRLLWETERL